MRDKTHPAPRAPPGEIGEPGRKELIPRAGAGKEACERGRRGSEGGRSAPEAPRVEHRVKPHPHSVEWSGVHT